MPYNVLVVDRWGGWSANLRKAVTELNGRVFNGNTITPRFYDVDKFEKGVYA